MKGGGFEANEVGRFSGIMTGYASPHQPTGKGRALDVAVGIKNVATVGMAEE
jgi:hypothetical protein